MFSVNCNPSARIFPAPRSRSLPTALFVALALLAAFGPPLTRAQEVRKPPKGGVADLSSIGPQTHKGDVTIAEDAVDIHYGNQRLRADHVEYNDQTNEAYARGHIIFDYENQHIEADEAHYNVSTGRGTFTNVRGFVRIELNVRADNVRTRRLYQNLGFAEEGVLRDAIFIDGEYYNTVAMALIQRARSPE